MNSYAIYIGIMMLSRKDEDFYHISSNNLTYLLTKKYPLDKSLNACVPSGINGLNELGLIKIVHKISNNEWIVDTSKMKIDRTKNQYYTALTKIDIQTILNMDKKHGLRSRSLSILRFYSYLLSTTYKSDGKHKGIGFTSLTDLSEGFGLNIKTVSGYLDVLEELELIYVYKSNDYILHANGDISEISHTYGRYCDKDKIMAVGQEYKELYGQRNKAILIKSKRENAKVTRSLSHKYNHMLKCIDLEQPIPYTDEECKEVYLSMLDLNEVYKDRPNRIKDLTIFQNYSFYNN